MNYQCAPGIIYKGKSCIPLEILEEMYEILKKNNLNTIIKIIIKNNIQEININDSILINHLNIIKKFNIISYKKILVDIINQSLKNNNQLNWLSLPIFKHLRKNTKNLYNKIFKPIGPNNNNEWLSNHDIQNIFSQYEDYYKDFKFLGAVPRDFDNDEDMKFSFINYNDFVDKGITKIGIIFNHDKSGQSGSHWVSLFINLKIGQIYYFDSVGKEPKKEINLLISKFIDFFKKYNINYILKINKTEHQQKNSECGVYSVSFILRLLDGESFDDISSQPIDDDTIQQCRLLYFN